MNEIIKKIEESLNIKLPQDYIEYMEKNNGYTGMINDNYYDVWKLEDIISRNNDYQVQEFFPNLIYFGSNGGDEAFAFDKSNNMCIVAVPFIGTEDDKTIIANNFNDFINENSSNTNNRVNTYEPMSNGDYILYFKEKINFEYLNTFFEKHDYDIIAKCTDDHIYVKSKNSDDYIATEICISNKDYNEYLIDFENDMKKDDPNNEENWQFYFEKMKKFNSYHVFKAHTETEAKYIMLLALYILQESEDVLVYDTYNGIYLDEKKLQELQALHKVNKNTDEITKFKKQPIKNKIVAIIGVVLFIVLVALAIMLEFS